MEQKAVGPLVFAGRQADEYRKKELAKANKIIGDLLSRTEMRSERFPVLYDILIKIRGLMWQTE
jgi:hypothetical protein